MRVKDVVKKVVKKYRTTSPYELASLLGINIVRCELGSIRGYYYKSYRIKNIILNSDLSELDERFVLAHEVAHAILHADSSTPFLKTNTLFSVNKMEIEANKFAMELLISDDDLAEYKHCTIDQISTLYGYNKKLIELRLK